MHILHYVQLVERCLVYLKHYIQTDDCALIINTFLKTTVSFMIPAPKYRAQFI